MPGPSGGTAGSVLWMRGATRMRLVGKVPGCLCALALFPQFAGIVSRADQRREDRGLDWPRGQARGGPADASFPRVADPCRDGRTLGAVIRGSLPTTMATTELRR